MQDGRGRPPRAVKRINRFGQVCVGVAHAGKLVRLDERERCLVLEYVRVEPVAGPGRGVLADGAAGTAGAKNTLGPRTVDMREARDEADRREMVAFENWARERARAVANGEPVPHPPNGVRILDEVLEEMRNRR